MTKLLQILNMVVRKELVAVSLAFFGRYLNPFTILFGINIF